VQATFPDGKRRLVSRRISLMSQDELGMSGVAAAVYLDAATGEPLALIRDLFVCEPSWSPLFAYVDNKYVLRVWLQMSGQLVLLALCRRCAVHRRCGVWHPLVAPQAQAPGVVGWVMDEKHPVGRSPQGVRS